MSIEKQQGMQVLGVDLSLSMSVKDRFVVRPHVMLNACLSLSWPDNSFRPRSRVAQLRPEDREVKVCTLAVGMKTDQIRMDITDITFVFIFLSGFGFEYG